MKGCSATGGLDDGEEVLGGLFKLVVDHAELIFVDGGQFRAGVLEALLDGLLGFGSASTQTSLQFGEGWRCDKYGHERGLDGRGGDGGADLACALHVDVQNHQPARLDGLLDGLPQGSIVVAMHLCPLQKTACRDFLLEVLLGVEMVVAAIHLARSRGASGAGNGETPIRQFGSRLTDDGGFAHPAGTRKDDCKALHFSNQKDMGKRNLNFDEKLELLQTN